MKRLSILLLILWYTAAGWCAFQKSDRGTAGAKFLKLGLGARPISMGEAFTAVADDVSAMYWNPAGLCRISKFEISASHTTWLSDSNHDYVGCAFPFSTNNQVIGLHMNALSYSDIEIITEDCNETIKPRDTSAGLSYSRSFASIDVGITAKHIYQKLYNKTMNGVAIDTGVLWRNYADRISFGASLLNLGSSIDDDPLPFSARIGSAVKWLSKKNLITSLDVQAPIDNEPSVHAGLEYNLAVSRQITTALRAGCKSKGINDLGIITGLSGGFGIAWNGIHIDYAFVPYGDLGNTHRISVGFEFGSDASSRVKAKKDSTEALALYEKGKYMDVIDLLKPYQQNPSKGLSAVRIASHAEKAVMESLDPDNLYMQALIFYKQEKYRQAFDMVNETLRFNPHHAEALALSKQITARINHINALKKEKAAEEQKKRKEQVINAFVFTSRELINNKKYEQAQKTLLQLQRYDADNSEAKNMMQELERKMEYEKLLKKEGLIEEQKNEEKQNKERKALAEKLYRQGLELYTQGNIEKAIQVWYKALEQNPSHVKTLNALKRNGKL